MARFSRLPRPLLLIMGIGLVVRLVLLVNALSEPSRYLTPDAIDYLSIARHLSPAYLDGDSPWFALGLSRTPGYPLFVWSLFGTHASAAVALGQVAVSMVTVFFTYRIGLQAYSERAGAVAALAVAVDPASVAHTNYVQPEILFTALVVAATFLLLKSRPAGPTTVKLALCSGLLFGLSVLVRPIALYLPLVLLPTGWLLWRHAGRQAVAASLALLLGFAALPAVWIVKNQVQTGVPLLSTIEGKLLLNYRAADAIAQQRGTTLMEAQGRLNEEAIRRRAPGMNEAEVSRVETGLALETFREHPAGTVESTVKGLARTLFGPGRNSVLVTLAGQKAPGRPWADPPKSFPPLASRLLLVAQLAVLVAIMVGAALGVFALLRSGRHVELGLLLGLAVYFVVLASGAESYARFRVPSTPYLAVLAGAGYAFRGADRLTSPPGAGTTPE